MTDYLTGLSAADVVSALARSGKVPEILNGLSSHDWLFGWEADGVGDFARGADEFGVRVVFPLYEAATSLQLNWPGLRPGWPDAARDAIGRERWSLVYAGLLDQGLVPEVSGPLTDADLELATEVYCGRVELPADERGLVSEAVGRAYERYGERKLAAGLVFRPDARGRVELELFVNWADVPGDVSLATRRVLPRGQTQAGRCAWVLRSAADLLHGFGLGCDRETSPYLINDMRLALAS
jgi:hypothetical protein